MPPTTPPELRRAAQYLRVSSEMQGDSIEAQRDEIAAFALLYGFEIVRSFEDRGRSGLRLAGRSGLQRLLADILGGQADYSAVLVQDVSRWGRFQDPDEAAHYEFICRSAGVDIHYCSEAFSGGASPASGVLKAVKRLMAAEFSRELSGKTLRAQRKWAGAGYKMGGVPGYGLRRRLVGADGARLCRLGAGEAKLLQGQRVVLELGPPHEVETVRRIYLAYLHEGLTFQDIADRLNAEGALGENGRPWADWTIAQVLGSEKYVGDYLYGRRRRTLDGRRISAPLEEIVHVHDAFPSIVSRADFEAVQRKRRKRMLFLAQADMVAGAAQLLAREGRLTMRLLDAAEGLPNSQTFRRHFGPLNRLHARLGAYPPLAQDVLPGYIDAGGSNEAETWDMDTPISDRTESPPTYTAFAGDRRLASGVLAEVALAVKTAHDAHQVNLIVFKDATGRVVDLDLRGTPQDVVNRLPPAAPDQVLPEAATEPPPRPGRGRPKLGVAAREVTLLPRHWTWLAKQPGGASAAIRRLVEQAARDSAAADDARDAQTATYQVMYALAGHLAHFEDALRALYAPDPVQFGNLISAWPNDIGAYVGQLAIRAFPSPPQDPMPPGPKASPPSDA